LLIPKLFGRTPLQLNKLNESAISKDLRLKFMGSTSVIFYSVYVFS
jgi:hypothetical protein